MLFEDYNDHPLLISSMSYSLVKVSSITDFLVILRAIQGTPHMQCLQLKSILWEFDTANATTSKPDVSLYRLLALKEIRVLSESRVVSTITMSLVSLRRTYMGGSMPGVAQALPWGCCMQHGDTSKVLPST